MTIPELIAAWDAGQSVPMPRIEGTGPSADQAVYILAVELLRTPAGGRRPTPESEARAIGRAGPMTIAQIAGARLLARTILRAGGTGALPGLVPVGRDFPTAPPPPKAAAPPSPAGLPGPIGTNFPRRSKQRPPPHPATAAGAD